MRAWPSLRAYSALSLSRALARLGLARQMARISLEEAIRTRNFAAIQAKSKQFGKLYSENANRSKLLGAAERNDVEMLACLLDCGCPGRDSVCASAAKNGSLACLAYAHEHGCPWDDYTCYAACENGHLACLKYAKEHGCEWNNWMTVEDTVFFGHLDCVHYLLVEGVESPNDVAKRQAAREVARGYLWPKMLLASSVRHWWFAFTAQAHHGTAAASLARSLADLAADEAMVPLAHAVVPLATAAGVTAAVVHKAKRTGGVKRILAEAPEGPIPLAKRRV